MSFCILSDILHVSSRGFCGSRGMIAPEKNPKLHPLTQPQGPHHRRLNVAMSLRPVGWVQALHVIQPSVSGNGSRSKIIGEGGSTSEEGVWWNCCPLPGKNAMYGTWCRVGGGFSVMGGVCLNSMSGVDFIFPRRGRWGEPKPGNRAACQQGGVLS